MLTRYVLNTRYALPLLRVALVGLFLFFVMFETLSLPGGFAYQARVNPEDAYLRWPATIVAVFLVVCAQVVIVAIWKLLTLVKRGTIFTEGSLKWVDVIVWAIVAAWVDLVLIFLWVGFTTDDPGPIVVMFIPLAAVTILGLLMGVMRELLRQATALRSDLEEVI